MEHAQQQSKARRGGLLLGFALESVKAFGWDRRSGYCGNPLGASFGSVPLCPSSRSGRKVTRSSARRESPLRDTTMSKGTKSTKREPLL